MSFVYVREPGDAAGLEHDLARDRRISLDCEAAGFHRYSDRLCLLQITTSSDTYVVDPLSFDPTPLLKPALEDPSVEVVMHGADYDLRLLSRDLGIRVRGLFDTQVAAALLGESALGLQALLEARLGVTLAKKYQRADWAERPLSEGMLDYAANDTRYLARLSDHLLAELASAGRDAWAREECRALEGAAVQATEEADAEDPVVRVKGARDLSTREVTALRKALEWRDGIARRRDKAPFRIIGDQPLLEAVLARPLDVQQLSAIKGFPGGLARSEGGALLSLLDDVAQASDAELRPYPRRSGGGPGRPPPEVEELAERLKVARNKRAAELGLDRGTLLPNAILIAIATARPRDHAGLAKIEGLRQWQQEAVGDALLVVLNRTQ